MTRDKYSSYNTLYLLEEGRYFTRQKRVLCSNYIDINTRINKDGISVREDNGGQVPHDGVLVTVESWIRSPKVDHPAQQIAHNKLTCSLTSNIHIHMSSQFTIHNHALQTPFATDYPNNINLAQRALISSLTIDVPASRSVSPAFISDSSIGHSDDGDC